MPRTPAQPRPRLCRSCQAELARKAKYCHRCGQPTSSAIPVDPRQPDWKYTLSGKSYPDTPDFGWMLIYDDQSLPVWLAVRLTPAGLLVQTEGGMAVRNEREADEVQRQLAAHRVMTGEKFPQQPIRLALVDKGGKRILH